MGKKKKKMTPAQAAAARREDAPKRKRVEAPKGSNSSPKDKNSLFTIIIPIVSIAVIVVLSLVFTIGPGMFMQQ